MNNNFYQASLFIIVIKFTVLKYAIQWHLAHAQHAFPFEKWYVKMLYKPSDATDIGDRLLVFQPFSHCHIDSF